MNIQLARWLSWERHVCVNIYIKRKWYAELSMKIDIQDQIIFLVLHDIQYETKVELYLITE